MKLTIKSYPEYPHHWYVFDCTRVAIINGEKCVKLLGEFRTRQAARIFKARAEMTDGSQTQGRKLIALG